MVWKTEGLLAVFGSDKRSKVLELNLNQAGKHSQAKPYSAWGHQVNSPEYQVAREWDDERETQSIHVREFRDGTRVVTIGRPPGKIEVDLAVGKDRRGHLISRTTTYELDPITNKPYKILCPNNTVWFE